MNPSSSAYVTHKRTRTGCQTCKRRRKRCDEQRPICEGCAKLGLRCVYDMSLRWGLTRDPFIERQRSIGSGPRSHDELGQVLHTIGSTSRLRMVIYSTLSASERQILLKFLTSGYRTLASDLRLDDDFLTSIYGFPLCEHSRACLLNCITYQTSIDPTYGPLFQGYYIRSLEQFRKEICDPVKMKEDSIFFAGMFMCIISFNRLLPWTNHLGSLISLVEAWEDLGQVKQDGELLKFVSTLGFLDLPSHCLNRKTGIRHVWHTYCQGQSGVNEVSALPFSLMDLLSRIDEAGIENALFHWPLPEGELAQRYLWETTRFAAILCAFERRKPAEMLISVSGTDMSRPLLTENILSLIRKCLASVPPELSHFRQALLFPLTMAAAQRDLLDHRAKDFIYRTIHELASERNFYHYEGVLSVVSEFWAGQDDTIEQTIRRMDIELALV